MLLDQNGGQNRNIMIANTLKVAQFKYLGQQQFGIVSGRN
jgi:hypothetical protein